MCPLLQDLVEVYFIFATHVELIHSSSTQFATPKILNFILEKTRQNEKQLLEVPHNSCRALAYTLLPQERI